MKMHHTLLLKGEAGGEVGSWVVLHKNSRCWSFVTLYMGETLYLDRGKLEHTSILFWGGIACPIREALLYSAPETG
jgi:hypothetical protein